MGSPRASDRGIAMKGSARAPVAMVANGGTRKRRLPKRFYKEVTTKPEGEGVSVRLDGKPVRTPAKVPLVLPNAALAEAVAVEWRAQGERIDPETMPLTKLANSTIDGVRGRKDAVLGDILRYAGSDLVCYRAEGPPGLTVAQAKHWNPVLDFAKDRLAAPLRLGQGVVPVEQPPASLDAIKGRLQTFDAWGLGALYGLTGLAGSALLALAVALKRLSPEQAWEAAHVDEDWQIKQWGQDEEARIRRANRWRDFAAAAHMLELLKA
jgi:chaperone required for assembly of F1-ATPase